MSIAFFDGRFMPLDEVRVSPLDRGYLFGDGVYEVVPVYAGRPFRMEEHLDRLDRSMDAIELAAPFPRERWRELLAELVKRNGGGEQSIYFQVTRGVAPRSHAFPVDAPPVVFMMSRAGGGGTPKPAAAITREDNRWDRCDIKSIALLANCLHKQAAVKAGASEAILLRGDVLTEGSSSNVFVVKGGQVSTPPKSSRILAGITRAVTLELMAQTGIPARERPVSRGELAGADEIWITSSTLEISPVVTLDGAAVGGCEPGPVWRTVNELLQGLKRSLKAA